jgi:hypothetical protein
MSGKDIEIKMEIEGILQNDSSGVRLITYFKNMPEKRIRRAIHILASVYPDKKAISDRDFVFIPYMLSNKKFLEQQNFSDFIRSMSLIDFTENQKNVLVNVIKEHFEKLCEGCTFELDGLLAKLLDQSDLFKYLEILAKGGSSTAVLRRISDILRYEDFSNTNVSEESLEMLRNQVCKLNETVTKA